MNHLKFILFVCVSFYEVLYAYKYVYVEGHSYVCQGQKRASGIPFHHSPPVPLRQTLFSNTDSQNGLAGNQQAAMISLSLIYFFLFLIWAWLQQTANKLPEKLITPNPTYQGSSTYIPSKNSQNSKCHIVTETICRWQNHFSVEHKADSSQLLQSSHISLPRD